MSFLETPRFPEDISYGATGGPNFRTDVVTVNSGHEYRTQIWAQARTMYDVAHAARLQSQALTLLKFFRAVQGRTHGFRFKDFLDFTVTTSDGRLGSTGVGTGMPTYQLYKSYTSGALVDLRMIRKPVSGTVAIYKNASLQTAGSGAGQYALDTTTGIVTWVPTATQAITSVVVGATTRINVAAALTGASAGKYVYLRNIAGTAGTYLNGHAWAISSVESGTGIFITANTTGMAASASTGNADMHPQASDTLTWSGEFDVPVRFDVDKMDAEILSKSGTSYVVGWSSIPLVEIRT